MQTLVQQPSYAHKPDVLVRPPSLIHVGLINGFQDIQALSDLWLCNCKHRFLHLLEHAAHLWASFA